MTNPWVYLWTGWIASFFVIEGWALFHSRRVGKGATRVDTLSRFTQWLVRAHQGDAGVSHLVFLGAWGLLAAWFPYHILG